MSKPNGIKKNHHAMQFSLQRPNVSLKKKVSNVGIAQAGTHTTDTFLYSTTFVRTCYSDSSLQSPGGGAASYFF